VNNKGPRQLNITFELKTLFLYSTTSFYFVFRFYITQSESSAVFYSFKLFHSRMKSSDTPHSLFRVFWTAIIVQGLTGHDCTGTGGF